jgi:hypothetical protein
MPVDALQAKYFKWINQDAEFPKRGVLYRGVIVDNVDPDKFGRVKVLIEGLTPSIAPDKQSVWAWTMNAFGGGQESGKKYGSYLPYPTGAKVFVLFEPSVNANDNAVIIGGWYQQDTKSIEAYDRYEGDGVVPNAWGWQTPNGHIIQCREEKDHYQIELRTPGNRKVIISDQKDEELITCCGAKGNEITIYEGQKGCRIQALDKHGNTILMDAENDNITIMCKETLTLMAKNIFMTAKEDITAIATQDCSITGTQNSTVQGMVQTMVGNESCMTSIEGTTITDTATTSITMTTPLLTITAPTIKITGMATLTGSLSII